MGNVEIDVNIESLCAEPTRGMSVQVRAY